MSRPRLNYDVIFVDEAQDLDPVMADVMNRQLGRVQMVAVGDAAQSIYRWRSSVDWLTTFPARHEVRLDTSFRFGQAVASEANVWLAHVGGPLRIKGNPAKQSAVVTDSMTDPDAILCRSNAGAIAAVTGQIRDRRRVGLVGGTTELKLLITSVEALQLGREVTHPDLIGFDTWPEVEEYAQTDDGADLAPLVKLVTLHGPRALLNAIGSCVPEDRAEVVVSTAHKAKGRQWNRVLIWGDFYPPKDDPETGDAGRVSDEEAMLAYVAVTRAAQTLDNGGLAWIHDSKYDDQRTGRAARSTALPPHARVPLPRVRGSSTVSELLPAPAAEYAGLVSF
jgi:superfamily I DNA/RNA helicase